MKVSIILLTYNQKIENIVLTLKSILKQDFCDYEIIVSDDGSKDNNFEQIEQFFLKQRFEQYELLEHKENQGTVCNLISALEHAKGEYVKVLGPGDLFFREESLKNLYNFVIKNDCEICYGMMKGYYIKENGEVVFSEFRHPLDIMSYRKEGKERRILKNLILYGDNLFGAGIFCTRQLCLEYLKRIEKKVIYMEDIFQVMAALEGKFVKLYDEYSFWYEMKSGISNSKNKKYERMLTNDIDNFYKLVYEEFPENEFVKQRMRLSFLYKFNNLYLRTIVRFFFNPDAIRHMVYHIIQCFGDKYRPKVVEEGFLDDAKFLMDIREE